jgi:hypothetical protein
VALHDAKSSSTHENEPSFIGNAERTHVQLNIGKSLVVFGAIVSLGLVGSMALKKYVFEDLKGQWTGLPGDRQRQGPDRRHSSAAALRG